MTHPKFSQPEVLVGYLQELKINAQGEHLANIRLLNDAAVEAPMPKELAHVVESDKSELLSGAKLIELSVVAAYRSEGFSMILDSFCVESMCIIQDFNDLQQWVGGFTSCGPSGWNQLGNPIEVWLDERRT